MCLAVLALGGMVFFYGKPIWPWQVGPEPEPLLFSSSEQLPAGFVHPAPAMAEFLLGAGQPDAEDQPLEACRHEQGLMSLPLSQWLVSVPLPRSGSEPQLHFVRPALEPFCMSFYGAHTFTFWLVQEGVTPLGAQWIELWSDSADSVAILPSRHEGVYDLRVGNCTATQCFYRTMVRVGDGFRATHCRREDFEHGKVVHEGDVDC